MIHSMIETPIFGLLEENHWAMASAMKDSVLESFGSQASLSKASSFQSESTST